MKKQTRSMRLDQGKLEKFDEMARSLGLDRSKLIRLFMDRCLAIKPHEIIRFLYGIERED